MRWRSGLPGGIGLERRWIAPAEHRFELAELRRLEAAGGVEPVAEAGELARRHRLQDVDLRDHDLQDGEHPAQGVEGPGGVVVLQQLLGVDQLVDQLLEPQLVHLVDDDEEHFIVLVGARPLGAEDLVEGEVRGVRQRRSGRLVTAATLRRH